MKSVKTVEECKEEIRAVLQTGVDNHTISEQEMEEALFMTTWEEIQKILDKAQGLSSSQEEACERLRLAREEHPLYRADFSSEELEKLKVLAPEEYELLK